MPQILIDSTAFYISFDFCRPSCCCELFALVYSMHSYLHVLTQGLCLCVVFLHSVFFIYLCYFSYIYYTHVLLVITVYYINKQMKKNLIGSY